jgi:hypothetical protein
MGVLTEADAIALEALCETVADLRAARQSLRLPVKLQYKNADGEAVEEVVAEGGHQTYLTIGKSGAMQRNRSEMALIADADRRLIAWCAKFGMTAAATAIACPGTNTPTTGKPSVKAMKKNAQYPHSDRISGVGEKIE